MKRKRGNKKGKSKKTKVVGPDEVALDAAGPNTEVNSDADASGNDEPDSGMEDKTLSSTGTDQPAPQPQPEPQPQPQPPKFGSASSGGASEGTIGRIVYSRVKVKIKASKALDSQHTSSDAPAQSDTDKSSQQVVLEKPLQSNKVEDSTNSLTETVAPENPSKKSGSIKIKSSRGFSSPTIGPCNSVEVLKGDMAEKKEPESSHQDTRYNKQQLDASLEVIKKVMKMDAAEPFNAPVNPIALSIPDYFEVIDTPMDFGTICHNIESGVKYMNSGDVYKDVQIIWGNCYKYNNKGDYVLELMKRVRKNFIKLWTAAGLYIDLPQGSEGIQMKDVTPSSHGEMSAKGGPSNHKSKKPHGLKKHKDGCLCAICVMMRKRQEREEIARMLEDQNEASDDYADEETKREETSATGSPFGGYTSSNMGNSPDLDKDTTTQEREEIKLGRIVDLYSPLHEKREKEKGSAVTIKIKRDGELSGHSQLDRRSGDEHKGNYQTQTVDLGGDVSNSKQVEHPLRQGNEIAATERHKPEGSLNKSQKAKMYENLHYLENPLLLELCGTLFADNRQSVWNGPRSLARREVSNGQSSIHLAISTFMK